MHPKTLKTALIQLNSGPDIQGNLDASAVLIREAATRGAQLICTPENTCHMRFPAHEKLKTALPQDTHPAIPYYSALAKELGIWLLIGSLSIKVSDDKIANRSFLFDPEGQLAASYDKIHLFDVDLPTGESHRESDNVQAGDKAVIADTPWGKVGMTICYDVRFAYLYRKLAQMGASILTVPAAFTVPTGKAHWEVLLRARAIETGSFILAPGQCGSHEGGRATYGHSLIIDPWGHILAEGGEEPGIIMADLDLSVVDKTRSAIPSLKHDRNVI